MPYFALGAIIVVAIAVMSSIKILREYERAVVFFLGRFQRVMGPGLIIVVGMLVKSRRRAVVTGREQMLGETGEALGDFEAEGWARVRGEQWKVRSSRPVRRGEKLRVTAMEGLVLQVEPVGITKGD